METLCTGEISSSNTPPSQKAPSISEQGLGHTHVSDSAGPSSQVRNFLSLDLDSPQLSYPLSPVESEISIVVDILSNQPGHSLGL